MTEIASTLKERHNTYGSFGEESKAVVRMLDVLGYLKSTNKQEIPPLVLHATSMILTKLVRAFNGDPTYLDNWHDIAGYATLVEGFLNAEKVDAAPSADR